MEPVEVEKKSGWWKAEKYMKKRRILKTSGDISPGKVQTWEVRGKGIKKKKKKKKKHFDYIGG